MSEKKGSFKTAGQNLKEGIKKGWDKYKSGDISYTIPSLAKKLWGKEAQNKRQGVRTAVLKDLHPKPKPKNVKNLSSKFKRKPSGEQEKISAPERLKEIKREDAMDNIKEVAKNLKDGGRAKKNPVARTLQDPKFKPRIVRDKTKYDRKRVKPYGMKSGGRPTCRGMGAATRGGGYNS